MGKYKDTIDDVQTLLGEKSEWKKRYKEYIETLNCNKAKIMKAIELLNVPEPFKVYMTISQAKNATDSSIKFDLRFHGNNVGVLEVDLKSKNVILNKVCEPVVIKKLINDEKISDELNNMKGCNWNTAQRFHEIYSDLDTRKVTRNKEHELESELLSEFSKRSSKAITQIQPVRYFDFQSKKSVIFTPMTTPLTACQAKKGDIDYSGHHGGGIDILARIGHGGPATYLAIIELKDKFEETELPEDAICQAIAYATFIRELLRSEGGQDWWNFFGFKGNLPEKLKLYAIIAMPNNVNAIKKFDYSEDDKKLGADDVLEIGYIYLKDGNLPLEVSENLPCKVNQN